MTGPISTELFLSKCREIQSDKPLYKNAHDGSDGFCDCIGLIIGAIRRAGGTWPGIHGSNYAARREMATWLHITSASQLQPGMVVYKGRDSTNKKYALPARYKPGGAYHNGDLVDYYHVGVVINAAPLQIMHCTSWSGGSGIKVDTQLGAWAYGGWLARVSQGGGEKSMDVLWVGKVVGGALNLRSEANEKATRVSQIPSGAQLKVLDKPAPDGWVYVDYNGKQGYVMVSYLVNVESEPDGSAPEGEMVTIKVSKVLIKELVATLATVDLGIDPL